MRFVEYILRYVSVREEPEIWKHKSSG